MYIRNILTNVFKTRNQKEKNNKYTITLLEETMKQKDDLYIALLKYGEDKLEKGVIFSDIKQYLEKNQYSISDERLRRLFTDTYEPFDPKDNKGWDNIEDDSTLTLSLESKFRLIDYQELQNANRSSRKATYWAAGAMAISILSIIISSIISYQQLITPTKIESAKFSIEQSQMKEILELNNDQTQLDSSLFRIIENQLKLIELTKEEEK